MQKDLEPNQCGVPEILNNLGVILGKLAIPPGDQPQAEASATRNPVVRAGSKPAPTGYPPFDAAQDMLSRV
jgi:hypothetical protein